MIPNQPFYCPEISEGRAYTTSENDQRGRWLSFPEKGHIGGKDDAALRGILDFSLFASEQQPCTPTVPTPQ